MFHNGTALRIPVNILFSILNSIEDRFEFWVRYDMFSLLGEVVYFFSAGCTPNNMIVSLWVSIRIWYEYIYKCISINN